MPDPLTDSLARAPCRGLLFIGDPHLASRAPGFRKDDYPAAILAKLRWALDYARAHDLRPVLLGDLFDFPRDNANWMLVHLLPMLRGVLAVCGNHDCKENSLGENDTLSILVAAGAVRLLDQTGPWQGSISGRPVTIGGTSWGQRMPKAYGEKSDEATKRRSDEGEEQRQGDQGTRGQGDGGPQAEGGRMKDEAQSPGALPPSSFIPHPSSLVFWVTHHDLRFPGYEESARFDCREIPGIDVVVNGHIHRDLGRVQAGSTLWINPGNIARVARSDASRQHVPAVLKVEVDPDPSKPCKGVTFERVPVPCQSFDDVFHPDVAVEDSGFGESAFIRMLAALESARTASGAGLQAFLDANLPQFENPRVADEIRILAKEVLTDAD